VLCTKACSVIVTIALPFLNLDTRTRLVVRYRLRPMDYRKRTIGIHRKRWVTVSRAWPSHYADYTSLTELLCMVQIL